MSLRSPLGKVLGRGSAGEGVGHWWAQRASALLLVPLSVWFLVALLELPLTDYAAVSIWMARGWNPVWLALLLLSLCWHSRLGVQVVIEDVKPTADYEAAWKPIATALAQAKYPLERRTYFSSYGTGRTLSFWMAPSAAVLKAAPTVEQAVASVVGAERAKALVEAWRACLVATQTLDVEPKLEMSSD